MASKRKLTVEILGEARGLKSAAGQAEGALKRFELSVDGVGTKLAKAFSAAALVDFGRRAVNAASNLAEVQSKTTVIFGQSSTAVLDWSTTTAKAMGQSQRAALEAATTFATFGSSAGLAGDNLVAFSKDLSALASDMASFSNTSVDEAVTAIGAALRGEMEPIRRYGVLLDDATLRQEAFAQGLIATTRDALTPQQKVLAAQAQILKQTSAAQGDFARTSGGLANQQRIAAASLEDLSAKVGESLVPAMTALVGVAVDLGPALTEVARAVAEVVGAAEPLVGPLGKIAGFGVDVLKWTSPIYLGAKGLQALTASSKDASSSLDQLAWEMRATMPEFEGVSPLVKTFTGEFVNVDKALVDAAVAMATTGGQIDMVGAAAAAATPDVGDWGRSVIEAAKANKGLAVGLEEVTESTLSLAGAGRATEPVIDTLGVAFGAAATEAGKAAQKARDYEEALLGVTSAALAQINAQLRVEEANDSAADAQAAYNELVTSGLDKGETQAERNEKIDDSLRGLKDRYREVAEAHAANVVATMEGATETEKAAAENQAMIDALTMLAESLEPGSPAYSAVWGWIALLDKIPSTVSTRVLVDFNSKAGKLAAQYGDYGIGGYGGAHGAFVTRPTMALIGEAGPEALIPLDQAPGASPLPSGGVGGGDIIVNVAGSVVTERQLVDAIHEGLLRKQRRSGSLAFT